MTFNSINQLFKTPADLAAWLASAPPPVWHPIGSTYHNTLSPTEAEWRGKASMDSMQSYYISKGWSAGPHCYLAQHSPNPADDGIWVMTPPTSPGIHSPSCNGPPYGPPPGRFGVEMVGDFQAKPPSAVQQQLLIDAVAVLHRWARLGPDLNAHRDCDARTCPGDAFYALKPQLQQRLAAALQTDPLKVRTLPGPAGATFTCGTGMYDYWHRPGYDGLWDLGYAKGPEVRHDSTGNWTGMPFERGYLFYRYGEGVRPALLEEATRLGLIRPPAYNV